MVVLFCSSLGTVGVKSVLVSLVSQKQSRSYRTVVFTEKKQRANCLCWVTHTYMCTNPHRYSPCRARDVLTKMAGLHTHTNTAVRMRGSYGHSGIQGHIVCHPYRINTY